MTERPNYFPQIPEGNRALRDIVKEANKVATALGLPVHLDATFVSAAQAREHFKKERRHNEGWTVEEQIFIAEAGIKWRCGASKRVTDEQRDEWILKTKEALEKKD